MKTSESEICHQYHVNFFYRFIDTIPCQYQTLDTSRMMILYFSLSGLDILGELFPRHKTGVECNSTDSSAGESTQKTEKKPILTPARREELIDWVYSQQVVITDNNGNGCGGFIGSGFCGSMETPDKITKYHQAHLSMTYCALLILTILGDDLSRVDRVSINISGL